MAKPKFSRKSQKLELHNPNAHPKSTRAEHRAQGKAQRKKIPRRIHGTWSPSPNRPDPMALLQRQDRGRVEQLIPIKYGRMLASPFAFLRGAATIMASDCTTTPTTGLHVQLCGDAHLSNFGAFASPERRLVFDINDFDETLRGPWEWDLKRLATSAVVAGLENGFKKDVCRGLAQSVTRSYRSGMKQFSGMHTLDVWYFHLPWERVEQLFSARSSKKTKKIATKLVAKARRHSRDKTVEEMTEVQTGNRRFVDDSPRIVRLDDKTKWKLIDPKGHLMMSRKFVQETWSQYLNSLSPERQHFLERFRIMDIAHRIGGIGSVGTRCLVILLEGEIAEDWLILQLKEAGPSCLEDSLGKSEYDNHAQRVVMGQRFMTAVNDMFLGWHTSPLSGRDFYWRQLKDMKGAVNVTEMDEKTLANYLLLCGWCLARAHARTGHESVISGYVGSKESLDEAMADFAMTYAEQNEKDYEALKKAVKAGRVPAETGL